MKKEKVKGGFTMRRNSRFQSLALAAALTMQTIGAPVVHAAEDVQQVSVPTEAEMTEDQTEEDAGKDNQSLEGQADEGTVTDDKSDVGESEAEYNNTDSNIKEDNAAEGNNVADNVETNNTQDTADEVNDGSKNETSEDANGDSENGSDTAKEADSATESDLDGAANPENNADATYKDADSTPADTDKEDTVIPETDGEDDPENSIESESETEGPRQGDVENRGNLIWTVDMNDLSQFDLYTGPNEGSWSAADNIARIDGGNGNKAISKRQEFTDFVLEADVTVEKQADLPDKSSAQGGILFRASKGTNRQNDGYFGYYLGVNARGKELILGRCSGNNWHEIAKQKMDADFGKSYHLTVVANGYNITCYADYEGENLATISVKDSTHQSGGIGMRNWLSHASFRNLAVSEYKEETDEEILDEQAAKEYLEQALDEISIPAADAIRGNITLPSKAGKAELSWESDNEEVISSKDVLQEGYYDIPAGVVKRGAQDEKVTLTVTATLSGVSLSKDIEVNVLANEARDENYVGYLYAHFKEIPGQKGEQDIFYGISEDGLNWTALNGNEAVLKSDVSDKATRDPYIIRSAEGDRFFLLATDQDIYKYGNNIPWDRLSTQGSTALTIWESTDLIHWTNERNVDVAGSIDGGCAWAPEAIYDESTGEYLVYWASKIAADNFARQYTFVSRTRDFYTFTEPELFNDFGSNIDTSMLKVGNDYYRLTKMEDGMYVRLDKASGKLRSYGEAVTTKNIGSLTFNVVGNNYSYIANTGSGCLESFRGNYEGGTMFKFNDRDEWCVMLDEYGGAARGYIPFTTDDLNRPNSIHVLDENQYTAQEGCKHGVILPVTASEYDALVKTYGVEKGQLAAMDKQDDPVAEYDFENADGTRVLANGKDLGLTLSGSAELKADAEAGNVLYLDGSDDSYAKFEDGIFDAMNELTIRMDVKAERADVQSMVAALGSGADKHLYMRVNNDETSAGSTTSGVNGIKSVKSSNYGTYGRWVHLDLIVKNNDLTFYADGFLVGTVKNRNISELGRELSLYLGKSFAGGRNFKGSIDNVRIYNKALTLEELNAKEAKAFTVKIEGESGTVTGKAKVVDRGDSSGGRKIGYIDDTSSTVTMKINAPHDGTYRVEIAADGDKGAFPNPSHRYWVNGDEEHAEIVEYKNATNWDIWSLYSVYVDLKEGENTFTVSHSGRENSFAELDYIVFHAVEVPGYELMVGDRAIEGFDKKKQVYSVDVDDFSDIPSVSVKFDENADDSFKSKVTQATADRPESYITVYSDEDPSYVNKYTIRFNTSDSFESSLVNFGADPFVTYHDGYYYYVRMGRNDTGIWVTKAAELSRIGKVEPVCVYMPSGNQPSRELWAPEIHFIDGKWYIYYTAGQGADHRMMVLESVTDDAQGEYIYKGKINPETDRWAIDQTVLSLDGQLYAIWSGWDGFVDGEQRLYIAKMENPWTISGDRVELSRPEYKWEVNEHPTINEGAEIAIAPDGTVNIVYSASGSWSDTYCLGLLTLKKGADPMKKSSWIKSSKPIFEKNDSTTFSTGHASFVESPDGTEDYLVFHATRFPGGGWNGRGVRAQRVYWLEDGTPFLGTSAEYTDKVKMPSGTKKVVYHKLEAENAELTGLSSSETYNSSSNACVYDLTDESKTAEFTFDVEEAGDYMLYVGASADVNDAALKISINGDEYEKTIYNFNANSGSRLCVDNWFGYEQKISLNEGSNTIVVSGVSGKGTAALDYIEYCKLEDALAPNPAPSATPEEPETPGTEPEAPGTEPETPGTEPEIPGTEPETPGTEPETPGTEPEVPGTEPETPGTEPEVPGTEPEAPGTEPEAPGTIPQTPGTTPQVPGTTPQNPGNVVKPGNSGTPSQVVPSKPGNPIQTKPVETKAPMVENSAPVVHSTGESVVADGASYTITSTDDGQQSVSYDKPENADAIRATIPATVTIDNVEYKVTEIAAGAFKGNKNLKKVTIGSNVEKIGKKTFYKCKNLKNVTISSKKLTKKSVGSNAFKGISSMAKIKVPKKVLKDYTKIFKAKGLNKKTQSVVKK